MRAERSPVPTWLFLLAARCELRWQKHQHLQQLQLHLVRCFLRTRFADVQLQDRFPHLLGFWHILYTTNLFDVLGKGPQGRTLRKASTSEVSVLEGGAPTSLQLSKV